MKSIRIGMIGLGRFSRLHLQCLRQIPGITVAAVADLDETRVNETVAEWNAAGYTDWRQMLREVDLHAVIVLTPEAKHVEPVIAALNAGCDVFVEKPLATDTHSASEIIRTAEQTGKLLTVGHVTRFDARYIKIKQALAEGRIGSLRSIYARRNNPYQYYPLYRRVSPVFILGIHDIDLMHWFTDSRVTEVYARYSGASASEHELVWSMLTFENGMIGVIENNWLLPNRSPSEQDVCMELAGEAGVIHFRDPDHTLAFIDEQGTALPFSSHWYDVYGQYSGALLDEMKHFFACVRTRTPSNVLKPEDAFAAVKVAEAVQRSCATGAVVKL